MGLDDVVADAIVGRAVSEDKLLLFSYMTGKVPVTLQEGKRRLLKICDLALFRYGSFDFHTKKTSCARDDQLYRLMMRIVRRRLRGKGPSLEELINDVGTHSEVVKHFGRAVSYDDVLPPEYVLFKYMTGQREVVVQEGGEQRRMRILSPTDLWVLQPSVIQRRVDEHLCNLLNRVISNNRHAKGPQWRDLVNRAGHYPGVASHLGRRVTYGDVGMPTPESDRQLLLRYLTGKVPVLTEEGKVTPRTAEDLWVFFVSRHDELTHLDRGLTRLYLRTHGRKSRGKGRSFGELFTEIGRHPAVKESYGRAVTYRDVTLQSLLHSYVLELEALMLGEKMVEIGGFTKSVSAIPDMRFLRPEWKFADQQVGRLKNRIQRRLPETGMGFYDLVDRAGARPKVVEMYGRPITRFDVNPEIGKYAGRRVYERPTGALQPATVAV